MVSATQLSGTDNNGNTRIVAEFQYDIYETRRNAFNVGPTSFYGYADGKEVEVIDNSTTILSDDADVQILSGYWSSSNKIGESLTEYVMFSVPENWNTLKIQVYLGLYSGGANKNSAENTIFVINK